MDQPQPPWVPSSRGHTPAQSMCSSRRKTPGEPRADRLVLEQPPTPARSSATSQRRSPSVPVLLEDHGTRSHALQGRPATAVSEAASVVSHASRRSARSVGAISSRSNAESSVVRDLPRPAPFIPDSKERKWHVPTLSVMGYNEGDYSDTSSVRTATTIREFFDEERKWLYSSSSAGQRGRDGGGKPPRPPLRRGPLAEMIARGDVAESVLPCVPPGKVPGGRPVQVGPARSDLLFAPRAVPR